MSAGNEPQDLQEKFDEQQEIIHEQMKQIMELQEEIDALADGEKDELIHEQMAQIVQLEEQVEILQSGRDTQSDGRGDGPSEKDELIHEQMAQILQLEDKISDLLAQINFLESKLNK